MKITNVDVRIYQEQNSSFGHTQSALVVCLVETDAGITGLGYTGASSGNLLPSTELRGEEQPMARIMKALIEGALVPIIDGQDPYDYERLWDTMFRQTYGFGRRGMVINAIAAIDIALWDIMSRAASQPLYKYLGAYRERVKVYANCAFPYRPPEQLRQKAREYIDQGYVGVKIRGGFNVADPETATEGVKAAREAIGPNAILMVDCNGTWDRETAMRTLKKWEQYDLFWIEEPVSPDDYDGFAAVAATTSIPVVTGEQHATRYDFRQLMLHGGVRIVQPDVFKIGGITEMLKVAKAAEVFGIRFAPHHQQEIHTHLSAALPNFFIQEYFADWASETGSFFDLDDTSFDFDPETSTIRPLQEPGIVSLRPGIEDRRLV